MIDYYNIGKTTWDEKDWSWRNRIIIPSYDFAGDLNFYVGRLYRDHDKDRKDKYKNADAPKSNIIFQESKIQWDANIYVVEGAIDCLYYPNAVALLGKSLSKDQELYNQLYHKANANIIICLDGDTKIEETKRIYKVLDHGRLRNKIRYVRLKTDELPWKDFGEAYEAGGKDNIIKIMKSAQEFSEFELLI